MTTIMTSQDAMKATLDSKIAKLKTLLQKASHMQTTPSNVGTLWEESIVEEGRT